MARAAWSLTLRRRSVDPDGSVVVAVELLDGGVKAADLTLTLTADRDLQVRYRPVEGADGLAGFQAWEG